MSNLAVAINLIVGEWIIAFPRYTIADAIREKKDK